MSFEDGFRWIPAIRGNPPGSGRTNPMAGNPEVNHLGMNVGNGLRVPQPDEFQFNGGWIPATPGNPPGSGRPNPVAENLEVNHLGMDHWPQAPSYDFFTSVFDPNTRVLGVSERNPTVCNHRQSLSGEVSAEWNNIPLLQLLLQEDSGIVGSADGSLAGAPVPDFQPRTSGLLGDCNGFDLGFGFGFSSRSLHRTVQDDFPGTSMINYDLNSPPAMESQPLTRASSARFTPVTPCKDLTTEKHQSGNLVQKSTESQLHCGEASQNIVDLSSSGKITDLGIDLNETPQQKTPKRRKHRPKVVVEGKPKRTPKNTAPKSNEPKAKRKYVRKNVLEDSTAQEEVDIIKESEEPNSEKAQKSCKRVLVFDLEDENQSGLGTMLSVPIGNRKRFSRENQIGNEEIPNGFVDLLNRQEARRPVASETDVRVLNYRAASGSETIRTADRQQTDTGNGIHGKAKGSSAVVANFNEMDLENVKKLMQSVMQPIPNTPFKSYEQRGSKRDYDQSIQCGNLYTTNYVASMLNGKASTVEKCPRNVHNLHSGIPQTGKKMKTTDEYYRDVQQDMLLVDRFSIKSIPISDATLNSQNRCRVSEGENDNGILFTSNLYGRSVASAHHSTLQIVPSTHNSTKILNPPVPNGPILDMCNTRPIMNKKLGASRPKPAPSGPESILEQAPKRKGRAKKPTYASIIDDIVDRFQILDIGGNGHGLQKRDQSALVLFKGNGALVPYEDDLIKKRKQRPKVDLDPESNRIWNLLMGKEDSDETEKNDEKKEKWWEEERKVFRGRVDSFIARMHLVQGDRGFSRWKGSVVDSVIGVFLTQNVSDHLSSSAFMSMAARFPLKPSSNTQEETANVIDLESPIAVETPNDTLRWYELSSEPGNRPNITPPEEELILSQESSDSSITQVAGGIRSCSGSNSETEDPSNGYKPRNRPVSALTDILWTEKSSFLEVHSQDNVGYSSSTVRNNPEYIRFQPSGGSNVLTNSTRSEQWWRETFSEESISSWQSPDSSSTKLGEKTVEPNSKDQIGSSNQSPILTNTKNPKARKGNPGSAKKSETDWDDLRKQTEANGTRKERRKDAMDSLDYEAMRNANVKEISDAIKERGMNNMLAERMKEFLNRVVKDHGSIDLEWLRDVPPDKAKDYLLSIRGLGLKSVECVRLLTLHHLAFPVDTNVGRIAVRLGWVPLQPLPESLQLHLLELYPVLETVQKFLWPRLCNLDQRTLYELHYQMITFGKVFCTKSKPNCNACPMRGECRHFASAFASARLALPGPEERHIVSSVVPQTSDRTPSVVIHPMAALPAPQHGSIIETGSVNGKNCEPIVEEPATPEQECTEISESDIEDAFYEDPDEIPTIKLDMGELRESLQSYMQNNMELQEADLSKALVALTPDVTSLPIPKLKYVNRLRTEHQVYELPDSHPLLERMERREPDDPSPYLLAIWTPGETANSIQPVEKSCGSKPGKVCDDSTCFSCNSVREANSQTVRGTILIPCRTAMRGSFPLNGTYFQVNEVFADHESSLSPINVPRGWIWNLPRRMVYFGTSVSSIFKGLTTEGIQYCFWKGFVCVRGFDMETRAPRPLKARLHFPASKLAKNKQEEKR